MAYIMDFDSRGNAQFIRDDKNKKSPKHKKIKRLMAKKSRKINRGKR